jgi:hypothetical protein
VRFVTHKLRGISLLPAKIAWPRSLIDRHLLTSLSNVGRIPLGNPRPAFTVTKKY